MNIDVFNNFYKGKKVLVTGHTGFKGSWLSIWFNELGAEVVGVGLEPYSEKDNFVLSGIGKKIKADIESGCVYILEDEGRGVGTVTVSGNHINRLFVLPECQHRGYGRYMMDFAEDRIAREHKTIELDASFPAKRIYLKRGYKETEYHTIETEGGDKLCYDVMVKEVT